MEISTTTLGESKSLLSIEGAVDAATAQTLLQTITQLYSQGFHQIFLDVSQMNFISSAGIRALLIAHQEAVKLGGNVKIIKPTDQVRRILDISGINLLIEVSEEV